MSLLYTIICKDHEKVLCEFTEYHGNFEQITRTLIKKSKNYAKASISYDDYYLFHFITENTITYLCMCEVTYPYESAFDFLNNIRENFERTYTTEAIETAYAYSFNKEFGQTLHQKMEMYNSNLQSNSINQIDRFRKGEISTREVLLKVEDLLITNEEKMNLIVKKFAIDQKIENLEQPYRNILFFRYTRGKSWEAVAEDLGYTRQYTCELHGEALYLYSKI